MKKTLVLALAAIMVLGVAGAAFADSVTYTGTLKSPGIHEAAGTVAVKATVNPKITLTIVTPGATAQTVDFGTVDPGATIASQTVNLAVTSNKAFSLTGVTDLGNFDDDITAPLTLARTLAAPASTPKGKDVAFTDQYTITVPADAAPMAYSASVLYTATQL